MKLIQTDPAQIICHNPDSVFGYFGWPSIARLPDGTLAMVASGFRMAHVCPFGKGIICYSRDEGRTWTAPAAVIDTVLDDRDCGLARRTRARPDGYPAPGGQHKKPAIFCAHARAAHPGANAAPGHAAGYTVHGHVGQL